MLRRAAPRFPPEQPESFSFSSRLMFEKLRRLRPALISFYVVVVRDSPPSPTFSPPSLYFPSQPPANPFFFLTRLTIRSIPFPPCHIFERPPPLKPRPFLVVMSFFPDQVSWIFFSLRQERPQSSRPRWHAPNRAQQGHPDCIIVSPPPPFTPLAVLDYNHSTTLASCPLTPFPLALSCFFFFPSSWIAWIFRFFID